MNKPKEPKRIIDDREEILSNWLIGLSIATAIMFIFASYNVMGVFHQIIHIFIME